MEQSQFDRALRACDDSSSRQLANGTRFIRKLPDAPPLAYLHTLYAPLDEIGLTEDGARLRTRLPPEFLEFLAYANGAHLFGTTVSILGFGENWARSISPEDQAAISIVWENEIFAVAEPERWAGGWTRVGAMVGWDSSWFVDLHRAGPCVVRDEQGATRKYGCFADCLTLIVSRIGQCYSCDGLKDGTYAELEGALGSLVRDG